MCRHDASFTEADCLYSPSHWSHDGKSPKEVIDQFISVLIATDSEIKAMTPSVKQTHKLGEDEREAFDIYGPTTAESVFIWIHGGYWQEGAREHVSPLVKQLLSGGTTVVSIGYRLASPNRPLTALVYDVAAAIEKALALLPNATRIVVGGHSAGAHLAFKACAELRSPRITGLALVAGIFDSSELPETVIGTPIGLTAADAEEATCRASDYGEGEVEVLVLVGECDTPRFRSQAIELHEALRSRKIKSQWMELPNEDHYSLVEGFSIESKKQTKLLKKFCSTQSL